MERADCLSTEFTSEVFKIVHSKPEDGISGLQCNRRLAEAGKVGGGIRRERAIEATKQNTEEEKGRKKEGEAVADWQAGSSGPPPGWFGAFYLGQK